MINWNKHRFSGEGVECIFTPRPIYDGCDLKAELAKHAGKRIKLRALWAMDDDDPYPGEWALAQKGGEGIFGVASWIASGDVTPVEDGGVE